MFYVKELTVFYVKQWPKDDLNVGLHMLPYALKISRKYNNNNSSSSSNNNNKQHNFVRLICTGPLEDKDPLVKIMTNKH
jgi:hypothetical protein